jgi:hypothetical protein
MDNPSQVWFNFRGKDLNVTDDGCQVKAKAQKDETKSYTHVLVYDNLGKWYKVVL